MSRDSRVAVDGDSRVAVNGEPRREAWYRQPVLWLGIGIFLASMAGCILMIVVGAASVDPPLPVRGLEILKMPLRRDDELPGSRPPPMMPPSQRGLGPLRPDPIR